ncbi:MAG TPA: M48 family metalloprotease, partial [Pseudoneobacillus sp.]|nr:M48 family metalloprotease [Pseudoneobacillus sp.]
VGLYLTNRIMRWAIAKWGTAFKIQGMSDIRSLPLLLMILSILMFVSSPLSNFVSRYQESRADKYAIEMTKDPESAITAFQELTRSGLSQVNPPILVKLFRYGHPTMLERISRIEEFEIESRKQK